MAEAHDPARLIGLVEGHHPRQPGKEVRRDPIARDPHGGLRAEQAMFVTAQTGRRPQPDDVAQHRFPVIGARCQRPASNAKLSINVPPRIEAA